MEDIIEEIFGEIEDEHDVEDRVERKISDTEYLFSARLDIDYLNETYDLNLPENQEYTTLAGMILHVTQDIPKKGEVIEIEDFNVIIRKVSENRIEEVALMRRED
jgi:CBS domain containing-hemolysin-like protein